jgi:predicted nucleic acid-binding protein
LNGWLLDTNVISALAPGKGGVPENVQLWLRANSRQLFLSAMTCAEIEAGLAKLRRAGSRRRADGLREWFERIVTTYESRILPFDLAAARIAGRLDDAATARGRHPGFPDLVIAATALTHDLVVATRNLRHFTGLEVEAMDPFAD